MRRREMLKTGLVAAAFFAAPLAAPRLARAAKASTLTFVIDESSDSPVSIRLSTQRAAFDGRVMLSGARLLQHPA